MSKICQSLFDGTRQPGNIVPGIEVWSVTGSETFMLSVLSPQCNGTRPVDALDTESNNPRVVGSNPTQASTGTSRSKTKGEHAALLCSQLLGVLLLAW
jgi:hypothetical protein